MDDMTRFTRMESCDWLHEDMENLGSSSQLLTPPHSADGGSPQDEDRDTLVSTTFYPGAQNGHGAPDLVVISQDAVWFYVHYNTLVAASSDPNFGGLLDRASEPHGDQLSIVGVPQSSTVLNLMLHSLYDLSPAHYTPSFENLRDAVHSLASYGVQIQQRVNPSTSLFTLLLSHAPLQPLQVYTLAAAYDLRDLAVPCSPHLLSFNLATLTDEMCQQMGAVYLKRLFFLHFGRADALKRLLLPPPHPHAPTQSCDFVEQKRLTRAWALACGYLAWDTKPDLSASAIEAALSPLGEHLSCELCQQSLQERVKNLVVGWSVVKRTI